MIHHMRLLFTDELGEHYQCDSCTHATRWKDGRRTVIIPGNQDAIHQGGMLAITVALSQCREDDPWLKPFEEYFYKKGTTHEETNR